MEQYIIIILAILGGKYIDAPTWQVVLTVVGAIWVAKQLNKDWEDS